MAMDKVAAAFGAIILIFAALSPAVARDRNLIVLNVGHSDIDDFDEPTVEANIEHSWARTIFGNGTWFSGAGPLIGPTASVQAGIGVSWMVRINACRSRRRRFSRSSRFSSIRRGKRTKSVHGSPRGHDPS